MDKINCFAYAPKKCLALKEKTCDGCRFYKTEERQRAERRKCVDRISTLPFAQFNYINVKYYDGKIKEI